MPSELYVEARGDLNNPVFLLHGLGCNGAVWDPVVAALNASGYGTIVPDFSGHGRSPWQAPYSLAGHAASLASLVGTGRPVNMIGHSMGASVGLVLATRFPEIAVANILAVGLKVDWAPSEIERMGTVRPLRQFATRAEAAERFLLVTGLSGLVDETHRCVGAGTVSAEGGFRLACDPQTVAVVREPVVSLLEAIRGRSTKLRMACGEEDRLVAVAALRAWDENAQLIPGAGHNAHLDAERTLDVFFEMLRGQ